MFHVEHCSIINLLLIKNNYTFTNNLKYFPGNNYSKIHVMFHVELYKKYSNNIKD